MQTKLTMDAVKAQNKIEKNKRIEESPEVKKMSPKKKQKK